MKKAILAALLTSAVFFGSEAMEGPGLASSEPRVIASFICATEPPVSIYRTSDNILRFCVSDRQQAMISDKVIFGGNTTLWGVRSTDSMELSTSMTDGELRDNLTRGFGCEVTVSTDASPLRFSSIPLSPTVVGSKPAHGRFSVTDTAPKPLESDVVASFLCPTDPRFCAYEVPNSPYGAPYLYSLPENFNGLFPLDFIGRVYIDCKGKDRKEIREALTQILGREVTLTEGYVPFDRPTDI